MVGVSIGPTASGFFSSSIRYYRAAFASLALKLAISLAAIALSLSARASSIAFCIAALAITEAASFTLAAAFF